MRYVDLWATDDWATNVFLVYAWSILTNLSGKFTLSISMISKYNHGQLARPVR